MLFRFLLHPHISTGVLTAVVATLSSDRSRVLKSALLISHRDFPGSQIRSLLHTAHTDNAKARENLLVVSAMLHCNLNFLTGPHTFIAISFESKSHLAMQLKLKRDKSVSS